MTVQVSITGLASRPRGHRLEFVVGHGVVHLEVEVLALPDRADPGWPVRLSAAEDGLALRIEDLGFDHDVNCYPRHRMLPVVGTAATVSGGGPVTVSGVRVPLLIPEPGSGRLLVVETEDGPQLPELAVPQVYDELHLLQRAARNRLGAEITVLRPVRETRGTDGQLTSRTFLAELHTAGWTPPPDHAWVEPDLLSEAVVTADLVADLTSPDPPERVPWMRAGWFGPAATWMAGTLNALGRPPTGPVEQYKCAPLSAVLRVDTAAGPAFFKSPVAFPLFCDEPVMMSTLARLLPHAVPTPLAIDADRRWMLTADFGPVLRQGHPTTEVLEVLATRYARLQQATVPMLDELLASGAHDRRLPVLERHLDELLADDSLTADLAPDDRAGWLASGPALHGLCRRLASLGVPDTLVHGDFHAGNVAVTDTAVDPELVVFDWTDACIAHPFLDLPTLIDFDAGDHAELLIDAYLGSWTDVAPLDRLREAYRIAEVLAHLHQLVSYRSIRANTEPALKDTWDWPGHASCTPSWPG